MELNKIYLGDAYELIKQVPDKSIDLIVTDPPYQFVDGGQGHSEIAERATRHRKEITSLDTEITKIYSGGGCFGTKNRNYHSQLGITKERQTYLDYINKNGKDEESERLRIIANGVDNRDNIAFVSKGIDNSILEEFCRVMKKINIYIWCNKNQLRQLIDFFDDKGCNIDLLTWNKQNPIPTCNNTYLSDIEYCVFAREKGVRIYGSYETKHKWFTTSANTYDKERYKHPTIKPLERIKEYLINSIDERERERAVVLDSFIGSGTTAVACKELGINYIGFELNEEFYKIACDRVNGIEASGQVRLC